jgi:type II secretory pathway predicted ATPase ExeA
MQNNPAELSAVTLAKLGLEWQPFATPENAEALYRNTALDMLYTSVTQQYTNTEQIQIIKGEAGLGKSSLCLRLRQKVPHHTTVIFVTATGKTGILEILKNIIPADDAAPALELPALAKAAALALYRHLCDGVQPVLLIDDAHRLTPKTLINLLRFQGAVARQNLGTFKLILVGERKIDTRLESVPADVVARENLFASLLRPLNRNEIRDYLEFKFKQKPPLNDKQLNYLRSQGGGIPGKIETLAASLLAGKNPGGGKRPFLIATAALLLAAGGAAYRFGYWPAPQKKIAPHKSIMKPAPAVQIAPEPPAVAAISPQIELTVTGELVAADSSTPPDAMSTAAGNVIGLNELAPQQFLIQVQASSDATRLEQVRQELNLEGRLLLHETVRNGKPWHLLLYGPFDTQAEAENALAKLPAQVQAKNPWIRRVDAITGSP